MNSNQDSHLKRVIGVDVGTKSIRLAIVDYYDSNGDVVAKVLARHAKDLDVYQDGSIFEQRSSDIWDAICSCCRICLERSSIKPFTVDAIGFSATCSLVVEQDRLSNSDRDVIMWMDHRSQLQADFITKSDVFDCFGGSCSPEFSISKILWLKQNQPLRFNEAHGFYELPDWLVMRCIGKIDCPRSLCSAVCKLGYSKESPLILAEFLEEYVSKDAVVKCGLSNIKHPGQIAGSVCTKSLIELGLFDIKDNSLLSRKIVHVGTGLIDAHSGMLGLLTVKSDLLPTIDGNCLEKTLCSLAGTSTCHMLLRLKKKIIKGIWGPYQHAILQDYYLHEAGQSMTGKLIEHIISNHKEGLELLEKGFDLKGIISNLNKQTDDHYATKKYDLVHVLPTFHGNRSPIGNSRLRGGIYGYTCERDTSLLDLYMATIESLAYETRYILQSLDKENFSSMLVSGGLMHNEFYMKTIANVLNIQVVKMNLRSGVDFMVIGASYIAYHTIVGLNEPINIDKASKVTFNELDTQIFVPDYSITTSEYYDKRYRCYRAMVDMSIKIDEINS